EAVSALDVSIQAQIINLLAELQKELGLTYLFIAHDLSVVRHISDRIAVMYLGEVVEQSPAFELYRNPLHPYTSALVSAVPIPDPAIETKRRRLILIGDVPSPANPPSGCRFHTRCWLRRELKNPERCVKERPVLRELLPDHSVACHYAEELVAKDRRQELVVKAAEATTGRTMAPEEDLVRPDSGGTDTEPGIFDLGSTEDPTIR
ncbi:MAG TPA: ABC transporter ATP-binding protein, partial [Candidatus Limnocylindria bacterium]|nr:ABC transporter ATP-binding protein [Candidatus Limnocylindria bacterium]